MELTITQPQIPERAENQDEVVSLLVFRRTDPANPDGGQTPDIGNGVSVPQAAFIQAVVDYAEAMGFDPAQSYATTVSVTDVEGQGGAIDLASLLDLANNWPPQ